MTDGLQPFTDRLIDNSPDVSEVAALRAPCERPTEGVPKERRCLNVIKPANVHTAFTDVLEDRNCEVGRGVKRNQTSAPTVCHLQKLFEMP